MSAQPRRRYLTPLARWPCSSARDEGPSTRATDVVDDGFAAAGFFVVVVRFSVAFFVVFFVVVFFVVFFVVMYSVENARFATRVHVTGDDMTCVAAGRSRLRA